MHTFSMQAINKRLKSIIFIVAVLFTAIFCLQSTAFASQKALTIVVGNTQYSFSGRQFSYYKNKTYLNCLEGVVDGIYYDTLISPIDATVQFNPTSENLFTFTKEKSGLSIDRSTLIDDINFALKNNKSVVKAKFITLNPSVSVSNLKKYTNFLAEFSTSYHFSAEDRKHNIKLATQKINGKILKSGEVFSFNQTVGERTEENGFKSSITIENGQYTQGVGGGVCQVSSTIYNTALLSGLKVIERHPHSIMPSYVEPSFDAMVAGNVCDLKFINTTSGNVYILAKANDTNVSFTFYGEQPKFSYKREYVFIEETQPSSPLVVEDETLKDGEVTVIQTAKKGAKTEGYIAVYYQNKQVKKTKLHTDNYKAVRGIIKVGKQNVCQD